MENAIINEDCGLKPTLMGVEKHSAFSLTQTESWATIDNCTNDIIGTWKQPNLANPFVTIVILTLVIGILLTMYITDKREKHHWW